MKLELRFFASLREALGLSQETIEVPEEVKTVSQLRAHLITRGGVWAEAFGRRKSIALRFEPNYGRCQYCPNRWC